MCNVTTENQKRSEEPGKMMGQNTQAEEMWKNSTTNNVQHTYGSLI